MKKLYTVLLALSVCSISFPQISEITRLPVQNSSQSIKESSLVWISENEIMIFFINETKDTIFSTKSIDRGISWSEPKLVQIVSLLQTQDDLYLTSLKSLTGRILLAWSVLDESMKLIYSDDYGENWSHPIDILGTGVFFAKRSTLLNLTQWSSGEICLSFFGLSISRSYYRLSYDNGFSWESDPIEFPRINNENIRELSIISIGEDSLLAIFERNFSESRGIYSRLSNDNGIVWSDSLMISDDGYYKKRPKVVKLSNGNIVVVYLRNNVNVEADHDDNDVFFKVSDDNGSTWSPENRFTKYIGEDNHINLSSFQNKTLLTFASERYSAVHPVESSFQVGYGILDETVEKFTPPKVFEAYAPPELVDLDKKEFVYRATVIDDESVDKVSMIIEDSIYIVEMFDDGMHFDLNANDSIYANIFPIISARYENNYYYDVNKIELPFDNKGVLADVDIQLGENITILSNDVEENTGMYSETIRFSVGGSQGKFEEGSFLFSGGFFLSGYTNGNLFANAVASAALVKDYLPGTVGNDPEDPLNSIYIVSKNDPPFSSSWRRWKDAVSIGAEFYDGDGDGIYNPVDKNWNGTWDLNEDMPPLIADEIAWCVYNDGLPANLRRWQSEPQGIEVSQTIFATNVPELENVIFIKYSLLNTGLVSEIMDSVYFGIWEDADVGDHSDDVVGCDTILQSGYYYNSDTDYVYGNNQPSFFTTLLQGPVVKTQNQTDTAHNNLGELRGSELITGAKNLDIISHVFFIGGDPNLNEPNSVIEARNYLLGKTGPGIYPDPCNFPYCEVRGGANCNEINPRFWASGDPVSDIGWIDIVNRDTKNLLSTGPFKLEKNKPQEIIIAYVMGRGTDYFNSITVARENVQRAIQEYESNFASITYSPPSPTNPVNTYVLYQNFPNPFNPTTTIRYELPQDGFVTIDIYDILGQKVKTILNEFKKADRYEVKFNSTGLASGVYIYRMKVNDFITSKKMVLIK